MPPRARKTVKQELEQLGELCAEHFPHGWSHIDPRFAAVGCEHGSFDRPADASQETAAEQHAEPETPAES